MKKFELILGLIRIPGDFLLTAFGLSAAYFVRLHFSALWEYTYAAPGFWSVLPFILLASLLLVIVFAVDGRYQLRKHYGIGYEMRHTAWAVLVWLGVVLAGLFFTRAEFFSRLIIIYAFFFIIFLLCLERGVIFGFMHYMKRKHGWGEETVLLLGLGDMTEETCRSLAYSTGKKMIGILTDMDLPKGLGIRKLGSIDDLPLILKKYHPDILLQTAGVKKERGMMIFEACQNMHVRYQFVPDNLALRRTNVESFWCGTVPVIEIKATPLEGWGRVLKRGVDLLGSGLGLLLLSPLFLAIAIAIKLDSPGPVFFAYLPDGSRVKRIGQKGRPINFLKFRSMRNNSHLERYGSLSAQSHRVGPLVKIKNDPRVTRVGWFLRRWSLDELPQLWNVFLGELSLVGPRAHLPEEVAKYQPYQRRVLQVKPGITGMAQVSGRSDLAFEDEVRLDLWYIENWSVWLDLKILLKTIRVVSRGHGAD